MSELQTIANQLCSLLPYFVPASLRGVASEYSQQLNGLDCADLNLYLLIPFHCAIVHTVLPLSSTANVYAWLKT
jgi:hypothetical protein